MKGLGRQVDRHLFRCQLILSVCLIGAIVLIDLAQAVDLGPLAILGGTFYLVVMASMVWVMVAIARGHRH